MIVHFRLTLNDLRYVIVNEFAIGLHLLYSVH